MKKNILVVDDESSARFLIELMLKKEYNVETAPDTSTALEVLSKTEFDVILMDINLGKSDSGINALKKIRQIDAYRNIPVVAVTAYALTKDRENLLNVGFTEYIAKPFEKEELLVMIKKLLKKDAVSWD